ncbi:nucleotidyltransferase domain-containing protein [Kluyvera cryocrescens]|uniref:nucleotidyltransferase domain-containing protein n=1 Tax=Kluyvera cryocrescens TaxID=580 RepID=UPI003D7F2349
MYQHHRDTIEKAIKKLSKKLSKNKKILTALLGGSVAHGFAAESSDIDLMLILSEEDYQQALHHGDLHYVDKESANYPGGYWKPLPIDPEISLK